MKKNLLVFFVSVSLGVSHGYALESHSSYQPQGYYSYGKAPYGAFQENLPPQNAPASFYRYPGVEPVPVIPVVQEFPLTPQDYREIRDNLKEVKEAAQTMASYNNWFKGRVVLMDLPAFLIPLGAFAATKFDVKKDNFGLYKLIKEENLPISLALLLAGTVTFCASNLFNRLWSNSGIHKAATKIRSVNDQVQILLSGKPSQEGRRYADSFEKMSEIAMRQEGWISIGSYLEYIGTFLVAALSAYANLHAGTHSSYGSRGNNNVSYIGNNNTNVSVNQTNNSHLHVNLGGGASWLWGQRAHKNVGERTGAILKILKRISR